MILGLDISTSVIGWCYLNEDGTYHDIGHIQFPKDISLYEKLTIFADFLKSKPGKITKIVIEEPLKMFKNNASMAQIISLLQRFNGMCCAIIHNQWNIEPELINPSSARKRAGIKVCRGTKAKEVVLHHVMNLGIIPEDKWDYKRTGRPKDWCGDQSDAYVVALSGV